MGPATPASSSEALVDARELARALGLSVAAVHRLSAAGRIPRYKAGHRTVRFDLDEVLAALRAPDPRRPPSERRLLRPAGPAQAPIHDLPPYDWSAPAVPDGSLPSADRRG